MHLVDVSQNGRVTAIYTDLNLVWSIRMIQPLRNLYVLILNVSKQWHYEIRQLIQRLCTQARNTAL